MDKDLKVILAIKLVTLHAEADPANALSWIKAVKSKLQPFVLRTVDKIKKLYGTSLLYNISILINPANLILRECFYLELVDLRVELNV